MKEKKSDLYPLNEFYQLTKLPIPPHEIVHPEFIPQPQQQLLVHQKDMTPTIENYYQQRIHINLKKIIPRENYILREVVLAGEDEKPLVFGAIRINLSLFSEKPRQKILECREPLGGILRDYKIHHTSNPQAFFRILSDQIINQSLNLSGIQFLYGRSNCILNADNQPLVEVIEILPP